MKDEANEMIRSEQEKVNISQDNLGKWRWASPTTKFLQVADSRVRAQLWTMAEIFGEQRGEIEHEDYER